MEAAATRVKLAPRPSDRLLEALATLAGLMDRVIGEVKALDGDYQERILQAVRDTEIALEAQAAQDLKLALEAMKAEFNAERENLNKELRRAVDAAAKLEIERSRLIIDLERVREEARAAASQSEATAAKSAADGTVKDEIAAVEAKLREIGSLIEDPAAELSAVIRKNVEKSELEAYLKGIRFAVNGGKTG